MGNTEDYLDELLNSMKEDDGEKKDGDFDSFDDDFLSGGNADEFMRQFEQEPAESGQQEDTDETASDFSDASDKDTSLDDLLGGLNLGDDGMLSEVGTGDAGAVAKDEAGKAEAGKAEDTLEDVLGSAGAALEDILGSVDLAASEETPHDILSLDFEEGSAGELGEKEPEAETVKDKEKKKSSGFLKKISRVLFGEEELEESGGAVEKTEPEPAADFSPADADGLSEEELRLLQELEGGGSETTEPESSAVAEIEEEAEARKKQEKAEKKAKKKAEKAEKKERAKAARMEQKVKKARMKKPQEPDNAPPLPKKPVILCFAMAASFLVLVLLGTNLFGYSSSMKNAEKQFALGNYAEAYQQVSGLNIQEQDVALYEKYRLTGNVAGEYDAYQTFMEAGIYDMALDSLVRAVGRCEKYATSAQEYGCTGELEKLRTQTEGALSSFGMTGERALELYAIEDRSEYSARLGEVLAAAGYMAAAAE